jgi:hypothetical protein
MPCALELCDEVLALSTSARVLLHQLAALFDGFNNGHIPFIRCTARSFGWRSIATLTRAFDELLNVGLIVQTRPASGCRCRLFALAWLPVTKPEGLTFVPGEPVPMPDAEQVKAAMKIARGIHSRQLPNWSLETSSFAVSKLDGNGQDDISQRDIFAVSKLDGKKKSGIPKLDGKCEIAVSKLDGKGALRSQNETAKTPLRSQNWTANRGTVNRPYMGVVGASQTTDPNPDPADSKIRGQS